ncbi:MAG: hypothetical protein CMC15_17370 [Flavobacteriaceae bacterium]|nr:hypothetical protein [Flavobacteriaceae bacterium]
MSPEIQLDIYHLIKKYDDWLKVPSRDVYLLMAKLWAEDKTEFTQIMLEQDLSTFDDKKKINNIAQEMFNQMLRFELNKSFVEVQQDFTMECFKNIVNYFEPKLAKQFFEEREMYLKEMNNEQIG